MKVLISRLSPPDTIGGAELSARDITRALQQLGHTPALLVNSRSATAIKDVARPLIAPNPLKVAGLLSAITYTPRMIMQFVFYYRTIKKARPDIIHPHSRHDQLLLTAVGKLTKKPVIWRDPGDLAPQLSMKLENPLQKLNRKLQLWSLRNADHIIMLNQTDFEVVHKLTGLERKKVSVIGSDILFADYTVSPNRERSVFTYGVISRLDKHKGVQYAIKAFDQLDDGNARLTIAGDGAYRPDLEKLAGTNPNIQFIGKIESTSEFFNQVDCLIQPSEFEGWGRTIKEAMLFNAPVIGSDVGGIADQIADGVNGLLFPVGDVDSLAAAMRRVQQPQLYKQLVAGGQQTIESNGDWMNKVEQQYIPLFERFL